LNIASVIGGYDPMSKPRKTDMIPSTEPVLADMVPTKEQIDALARRLMPEIKRFFADEQVQQEFARWQERKEAAG